jgi:hypothetical protein
VAKVATKAEKARELAKAASATKGQKLASKGLNFAEKATKYGYIPATGMAEGTASGYFATDSAEGAKVGAAIGGVASGAFGALGGAYKKGYDIYNRTKEIGRGMQNIAQSDKGVRLMKKSIEASPTVAKTVRGQVDEAYDYLNKKAADSVSSAFGKADAKGSLLQAKKGYSSFIDENIDEPHIEIEKTVKHIFFPQFFKSFYLLPLETSNTTSWGSRVISWKNFLSSRRSKHVSSIPISAIFQVSAFSVSLTRATARFPSTVPSNSLGQKFGEAWSGITSRIRIFWALARRAFLSGLMVPR